MIEYDKVLSDDYERHELDVDVIYPDGSKIEMFLEKLPKVGEIFHGHIVEKIQIFEVGLVNECEARIQLKRRTI